MPWAIFTRFEKHKIEIFFTKFIPNVNGVSYKWLTFEYWNFQTWANCCMKYPVYYVWIDSKAEFIQYCYLDLDLILSCAKHDIRIDFGVGIWNSLNEDLFVSFFYGWAISKISLASNTYASRCGCQN